MAKLVWKNPHLTLNAVDLSDHVKGLTIDYKAEIIDNTCSGDATRAKLPGLKDWSVTIEFAQDYAASEVDATLFSLVGAAAVAVAMRPTTDSVGATNPSFAGNVLVESYPPIAGTVGAEGTATVTLQGTGTLARNTA